jgi:hypothetical protein
MSHRPYCDITRIFETNESEIAHKLIAARVCSI